MRNALCIMLLALRRSLREHSATSICVLIALLVFVLPVTLTGDGSLEGKVRLVLQVTMGSVLFFLSLSTLWLSCSAVASDLKANRLQLVLAKPVRLWQVWLGHWMAILLINAAALSITFVGVHIQLDRLLSSAWEEEEEVVARIRTARWRHAPLSPDISAQVQELLTQAKAENVLERENMTEEELLQEVEAYSLATHFSAGKDQNLRLDFDFGSYRVEDNTRITVQVRYAGVSSSALPFKGTWTLTSPEAPSVREQLDIDQFPAGTYRFTLNNENQWHGNRTFTMQLESHAQNDNRVFFDPYEGIFLFTPGDSATINLFRACLTLAGFLTTLAALGLSAGSLFSTPVAIYVASFIVLAQSASGLVREQIEAGVTVEHAGFWSTTIDNTLSALYHLILLLVRPFSIGNPISDFSNSVVVSWAQVGKVWCVQTIPFVVALLVLSHLLFSKREAGVVNT